VVGLSEVLGHFPDILAAKKTLAAALAARRPALLVLIDFPEFNLMLAARARRLGIPVFYYISPQIWAWRRGRVKKIRRLVDRMAVILPFEEEFYRGHGVEVEFVGHPLVDELNRADIVPAEEFLAGIGADPGDPAVAVLPGSRRREVEHMLPGFCRAVALLSERTGRRINAVLPLAPGLDRDWVLSLVPAGTRLFPVGPEERYSAMAACRAACAASGTVTLELALLGVPPVVAYRVSPLTYHVGMMLVRTEFFSLVNLIAGRAVVEELLQDQAGPENIARALAALMEGEGREAALAGLAEVARALGPPGASRRAAAAMLAAARYQRPGIE
jgi:lipid-A-disaccharide synthase